MIFRLFGETPLARWHDAESIYDSVNGNAIFKLYEQAGHTTTPDMVSDIEDLFSRQIMRESTK